MRLTELNTGVCVSNWLSTATPTPWTWAILTSNDAKRYFIWAYRQLHKYGPMY